MYAVKQIHVDVDTIVSFVMQSGQELEGGRSRFILSKLNILSGPKGFQLNGVLIIPT